MEKFCKVFENPKGEQILYFIRPNEETNNKADLVYMFNLPEGETTTITGAGIDWDKAEEWLENRTQETAETILKDPMGHLMALVQ